MLDSLPGSRGRIDITARDMDILQQGRAERFASVLQAQCFLDDCDEAVADALDEPYGFRHTTESFSASLSSEADELETAVGSARQAGSGE